jgi:hypothetical protein
MKVFMYSEGPQEIIYLPGAKIILASCPCKGGYIYLPDEPDNVQFFEKCNRDIEALQPIAEMDDLLVRQLAEALGPNRKQFCCENPETEIIKNFIFSMGANATA